MHLSKTFTVPLLLVTLLFEHSDGERDFHSFPINNVNRVDHILLRAYDRYAKGTNRISPPQSLYLIAFLSLSVERDSPVDVYEID